MTVPVPGAIADEFGIVDLELGVIGAAHDAIFVVFESTVANDEPTVLEADSRAVLVRDTSADEFYVFDCNVFTAHDPDRLSLRRSAASDQAGPPIYATDRQMRLRPYRDVADIVAGLDLDRVSVLRDAGRLRDL